MLQFEVILDDIKRSSELISHTGVGICQKKRFLFFECMGTIFIIGLNIRGKFLDYGKPVIITFQIDVMLFRPNLVSQSSALYYWIISSR